MLSSSQFSPLTMTSSGNLPSHNPPQRNQSHLHPPFGLWGYLSRHTGITQPNPPPSSNAKGTTPSIAPLDKAGASTRILLHDTQAHLERFGERVTQLTTGVADAKRELVAVQKLYQEDHEQLVERMIGLGAYPAVWHPIQHQGHEASQRIGARRSFKRRLGHPHSRQSFVMLCRLSKGWGIVWRCWTRKWICLTWSVFPRIYTVVLTACVCMPPGRTNPVSSSTDSPGPARANPRCRFTPLASSTGGTATR